MVLDSKRKIVSYERIIADDDELDLFIDRANRDKLPIETSYSRKPKFPCLVFTLVGGGYVRIYTIPAEIFGRIKNEIS